MRCSGPHAEQVSQAGSTGCGWGLLHQASQPTAVRLAPPQMTSALTPPPALRPVSMDLLRPQCLEVSRGTIRPPAAFSHRELPQTSPATTDAQPSVGPEATYSNVGLAAIPRASLAASPVVWAGARLTSSWARPGPEARPELAEYARVHKLKGADQGPQGLEQGRAQGTAATQVK